MKNFSTFGNTMLKSVLQMDRSLFYYINNRWSNDAFDAVMPFIRNQYFWVPLYLFLLIFVFTNFHKKAWWWLLFFLATFALTDLISASVIKTLVERPRPCVDPIASETVRMLIPCSYGYSFVSSHATNHFGMAMFMFMSMKQFSKRWIWLVFAWAFVISFAQVYVGAHFPIDVFCGSLLGMFIGHRTAIIFNKQFGGLQVI